MGEWDDPVIQHAFAVAERRSLEARFEVQMHVNVEKVAPGTTGTHGLMCGNGPSMSILEGVELPEYVTVYGVNRMPPFVRTDWYCALDKTVEEKWIPKEGAVKGFVTNSKHRHSGRDDAFIREFIRIPPDGAFRPQARRPSAYYSGRVSTSFMVQWALENGEKNIGLLGIEYSSRDLCSKKEPTHWYGTGDYAHTSPTLSSRKGIGTRFWGGLLTFCGEHGIRLVNLCPYDTPFDSVGIPKMGLEEWLDG